MSVSFFRRSDWEYRIFLMLIRMPGQKCPPWGAFQSFCNAKGWEKKHDQEEKRQREAGLEDE